MLFKDANELSKDLLAHLQDPEFHDIKIEASDREVPASKTIISMRSQYFRSMFSANNNFVESSTGTVKLPYRKVVIEKVVTYLYSGEMDCEDLSLRSLLDLLELLNIMNLPGKYSVVEAFTVKNVIYEKYPLVDCLKSLDECSKMGLKSVGETLLAHLGRNFRYICEREEVGYLSLEMISRLLKEKKEEGNAIFRMKTYLTRLKVTSKKLVEETKDKMLNYLDLDLEEFTHKELASPDVRNSGLYDIDKIMERMKKLFEEKEDDIDHLFETRNERVYELEDSLEEKETKIKQMTEDMKTVKSLTAPTYWHSVFPNDLKKRYEDI